MAPDLCLEGVPAADYDLTACNIEQLNQLESHANAIIDRIRDTKKGSGIVASLVTRHANRQFVRCTDQSVKTTATARYHPLTIDLDLSGLTTACFVGVVTYLPLPAVKSLVANNSAVKRAEEIWKGKPPDSRWAIYYERLTSVNQIYASMFLEEVQSCMDGVILHRTPRDLDGFARYGGSAQEANVTSAVQEVSPGVRRATAPDNHMNPPSSFQNESLLLKVIKAKGSAWGIGHPTTISSVILLATLYVEQTRLTEAKALLLRSFREWKKTRINHTPDEYRLLELLAEVDCHLESRCAELSVDCASLQETGRSRRFYCGSDKSTSAD